MSLQFPANSPMPKSSGTGHVEAGPDPARPIFSGIPSAKILGTHVFRRGMARDILDSRGNLATLLHAGDWRSSAFAAYLRQNQLEERAVTDLLIDHSDSEAE